MISLRPEESFDEEIMDCYGQNNLGLLLSEEEAEDVVRRSIRTVDMPSL